MRLGRSDELSPQLVATMSVRPSPSKSPVATPCQRPVNPPRPSDSVTSLNLPFWFLNTRTGPHSVATINSGKRSPSRSLNTAPFTMPSAWLSVPPAGSRLRVVLLKSIEMLACG